jgi:hypothetical protein
MTNPSATYDDLIATVRPWILRARGVGTVDALEIRRTLNELAAEMRDGKTFEAALALACRPVDGLGPEDPPVASSRPNAGKPRPVLLSATVSDEDRHARQRQIFETQRRRADAARPAPKPMPPKAPISHPNAVATTLEQLATTVIEVLRGGPRSTYDIAFRLIDDPSPHEVGAALMVLRARHLVERIGRGRVALWRLVAKGAQA